MSNRRMAAEEGTHAMDSYYWMINELIAEQRIREEERRTLLPPEWHAPREGRGVRHAFATSLVRLGLRLDPAAGEGLGGRKLSFASREAR
jgi:hypothetical protein